MSDELIARQADSWLVPLILVLAIPVIAMAVRGARAQWLPAVVAIGDRSIGPAN